MGCVGGEARLRNFAGTRVNNLTNGGRVVNSYNRTNITAGTGVADLVGGTFTLNGNTAFDLTGPSPDTFLVPVNYPPHNP